MLTAYETAVASLLQAPSSPTALIPTAQIDTYINTARLRVASEGECVRATGTLTLAAGLVSTVMSGVVIADASISGALNVRQGSVAGVRLDIRSWEWFSAYYLSATAGTATPRMAQLGEGQKAILYFLSLGGSASLDVVAEPIPLVSDGTAEAIPYPWTDAVPFYAAWLAFQQLQRQADAEMMMGRYRELMRAAREDVTPTVLPDQRPGGPGTVLASAHQSLAQPAQPQRGG